MRKFQHKTFVGKTGWLICLLFTSSLYGQALRLSPTLQYTGLMALSRHQADVFSWTQQQAALADVQHLEAGVFAERRYLLPELGNYSAALAFPTVQGNMGVLLRYAGFSEFNERQVGIAYARKLGKHCSAGIQFNHYSYSTRLIGTVSTLNTELGILFRLPHLLSFGLHVYNPVGGYFRKTGERLQPQISLGIGYEVSPLICISAELQKELREQVQLLAALQYHFAGRFFCRAGLSISTGTGTAGVGFCWKQLRMDFTSAYHPQLGWSPGMMLIWQPVSSVIKP